MKKHTTFLQGVSWLFRCCFQQVVRLRKGLYLRKQLVLKKQILLKNQSLRRKNAWGHSQREAKSKDI
nr:hypothetical protein [uncultured Blautia sp.]